MTTGSDTAPRVVLLLPAAFLVHLAEEWFGGFLAWTPATLGYSIAPDRFAVINGIAAVVFVLLAVGAVRRPALAWLGVSLAALLGLNGLLHLLATVGFGRYAPGVVSGVLLYLPLATVTLRALSAGLPRRAFVRGVVVGLLLHALVPLLAFAG